MLNIWYPCISVCPLTKSLITLSEWWRIPLGKLLIFEKSCHSLFKKKSTYSCLIFTEFVYYYLKASYSYSHEIINRLESLSH